MRTLKIYTSSDCKPCTDLKKSVSALNLSDLNVVTIDVHAWREEAQKDGIRSVPTIILLESGVELSRKVGAMSVESLKYFVTKPYGFAEM